MTDNRTEALEWAEESSDDKTLAVTHALLYVGDVLADIHLELAARREGSTPVPPSPKLQALLKKPSPFRPEAEQSENGAQASTVDGESRRFMPRHDPADWTKLPDGRWESPTGRKYQPWTRQAFGVITARRKRGLSI